MIMELSVTSLFLTMLVGMGPLKSSLMFMEKTEDVDLTTRRKMALAAVTTGVCGALSLLFLGSLLQKLLHFSLSALSISGGTILLILAVRLILGDSNDSSEKPAQKNHIQEAISPLGIPLMFNPVGMVALITFSAQIKDISGYLMVSAVIFAVALLDLIVFLLSGRAARHISHAVITVAEKLFSVLISALAVQMIVDGMADLGIISQIAH